MTKRSRVFTFLVAGFGALLLSTSVGAQTPDIRPVGKVDGARFEPLLKAGVETSEASRSGKGEFLDARSRALEEALLSAAGTESSEADRMFVRAMNYASAAFIAAVRMRDAAVTGEGRADLEDISNRYGVSHLSWTSEDRYKIVLREAAGFVRAASRFYAGKFGEGLDLEKDLFDKRASRQSLSRPSPGATKP